MKSPHSPATLVVRAGRPQGPGQPLNVGIEAVSAYQAGGERRYAREGTPTWDALEHVVGTLEGGTAVAFGSGLAAVAAALELAPPGGRVAASRRLYVGSRQLLADMVGRHRIRLSYFDEDDDDSIALSDLVLIEDPTNPGLERVDVAAVVTRARGVVVVDNTVATPIGRRPLELGADVVVHSATKYLGGHSDLLMGVAIARDREIAQSMFSFRRLHGAVPGTLEAYLALRGIRTLAVRMERATANARELAQRLGRHPAVVEARHPGLGALIAMELRGGSAAADAFIERLQLWIHATSLGGVESTLERRARWADESPDVSEGLIRMSVGIEDVEDLWADLDRALEGLGGGTSG